MPITVKCESEKGGAVQLCKDILVSYAVAGVADLPKPEVFQALIKLENGKRVNLFVNRETGLVVVDIPNKRGNGGKEILRTIIGDWE
jgi:hypothetical protein